MVLLADEITSETEGVLRATSMAADLLRGPNRGEMDPDEAERGQGAPSSSSRWTLARVLDELGPLLVSKDVSQRRLGLAFLGRLLGQLPPEWLPRDECGLLSRFYCDRTRDHHSLQPEIIRGIGALSRCSRIDGPDLRGLVAAFYNNVHTQSQMLEERRQVHDLFLHLLETRAADLEPMGSDFVLGFVQAVDGEKDPVNLTKIFRSWPVVLKRFELEPFVEDVFETMACYFPVDFNPPKASRAQQAFSVTKQELVEGLRACLASNPVFAPLAIPLFLDKLGSDVDEAKIDSNVSLKACIQTYSAEQLEPFLDDLWNSYKRETMGLKLLVGGGSNAFGSNDTEGQRTALEVLEAITLKLEASPEVSQKWTDLLLEDILPHLNNVELRPMHSAVKVLTSSGLLRNQSSCHHVLDQAMPKVVAAVDRCPAGPSRASGLCLGAALLSSAAGFLAGKMDDSSWCRSYLEQCETAVSAGDQTDSGDLREAGAVALKAALPIIDQGGRKRLFDCLFKALSINTLGPAGKALLLQLSMESLDEAARPDQAEVDKLLGLEDREAALEAVGLFCRNPDCLRKLILPRVAAMVAARNLESFPLCCRLLKIAWEVHSDPVHFEPDLLEKVALVARGGSSTVDDPQFKAAALELFKAVAASGKPALSLAEQLVRILEDDPGTDTSVDQVSEAIIVWGDQSLLDWLDSKGLIEALFGHRQDIGSIKEDQGRLRLARSRSSIVNKLTSPERVDFYLGAFLEEIERTRSRSSPSSAAVLTLVWLLKALIFKSYPRLEPWVQLMHTYLEDDDDLSLVTETSTMVSSFVMEDEEDLEASSSSFLVSNKVTLSLTRQKFFALTKSRLLEVWRRCQGPGPDQDSVKASAQVQVLVSQLPHLPDFVLADELEEESAQSSSGGPLKNYLLPMLLVALKSTGIEASTSVAETVLDCLQRTLVACRGKSRIEEKLLVFLPTWLELATSKSSPIEVRVKALQCVKTVSRVESSHLITPLKKEVLAKLGLAIDDHKRVVRKVAAEAKNSWCLATS